MAHQRQSALAACFLLRGRAQQVQRQVYCWPFTGHVILQVRVQSFIAQVYFRRQGDNHDGTLKRTKAKLLLQFANETGPSGAVI